MYEPHALLERSLLKSGQAGSAEVLGADPATSFADAGVTYTNNPTELWDIALRVTPEGESPFDVHVKMRISSFATVTRGAVLQVLFDPKDHERIVVDPRTLPKNAQEMVAGIKEAQSAKRESLNVARNEAMAQMLQARRDGTLGATPPVGAGSDVTARMAQLERLKDAGMIDDDQYQTKKQQLLDQL